jgi:beta-N-acetylhexosaminidase
MSLGPIMMGIEGYALSPEERELLLRPRLGGVILFTRNFESAAQVASLTESIHSLRDPPLLVAVDQEGGRVQRFRTDFTLLPPVSHLGAAYDRSPARARKMAEAAGWLMASELRSVGVDFSFAPVLDLDRGVSTVIGDRAFHKDPQVVADLGLRYVRGMRRAGMAATAKHFPGHGSVREDSHHELPLDHRSYRDLIDEDLLPFERMCAEGIEAMMAAHILYPEIDARPVGFSSFWLRTVLRERLGFQGVIFSDDLLMEGAKGMGDVADRAVSALEAGCDMILICRGADAVARAAEVLESWNHPVSPLRLARMHGRHALERDALRRSAAWHEAVKLIAEYGDQPTLDLL